ncbi:clamp loader small subunit [Synechococcus phage S-SCSM1]|uniref:Clamp loader small subunit n=1 Tax=Synechococcus phage S-SCSM1 TaxID=2588487 RepID=A0A6M2ZIH3_9CAUD|nr:clamp loader small subunit [Synechococcus phage S-SCSM1]QFG06326.1 clamp loader small subunit [Synechococcus phage S-SCSM1]
MELKDWMNSINLNKENLIKENPDIVKQYPPFIVNKCLSGHLDAIMFANEMNKHHHLDKDMQYSFLLNSLRKKKRFSPWIRKEKIDDLDAIKQYYGYSNEKSKEALRILSKEQINFIKFKIEKGGKR